MSTECEKLKEDITAMADGEISPLAAEKVHLHLSRCPVCRQKVEEIKKMQEWMRESWPDIKPSKGFDEMFMASMDREKSWQKRKRSRQVHSRKWVAACVLAFFLITGGIWLTRQEKEFTMDQVIIAKEFELFSNMAVIKNLEALENFDLLRAMNEI